MGLDLEIKPPDSPKGVERYFDGWRRAREKHYASRPARRGARRAVLTIVHNEPVFLPIWLRFYSRFFEPGDIHVLDNDTTDGSTSGTGFVRIPVSHDRVDHVWMAETLAAHQRRLLESYDVVLVCDVDEIVVPDPAWGTLGDYLDRFDEEFVNAFGYELIHLADREPPYDPARPVLEQRAHWFANNAYDKPAIATVPMSWKPGLHERSDARKRFDPDLRLIHLHRLDYELCRERHRLRKRRAWGRRDLEGGWAAHNRITSSRRFRRWFYERSGLEDFGIEMEIERIPDRFRGLF